MARSPITRDGYNQLHKELENLKKVVRPQVIKAIEEARAHGIGQVPVCGKEHQLVKIDQRD
jgi:hypothetical protein